MLKLYCSYLKIMATKKISKSRADTGIFKMYIILSLNKLYPNMSFKELNTICTKVYELSTTNELYIDQITNSIYNFKNERNASIQTVLDHLDQKTIDDFVCTWCSL